MAESNKGTGVFFYSEINDKEDMGSASLQKFNSVSTKGSTKSKKKLSVSGDSKDINFRVDRMTAVGSFITSPSTSSPSAIARGETQQNNNNNPDNNIKDNKNNNNSAVISSSPLSRSRSISTPPSPSLSLNNNNNNNNNNIKTRIPSHKSMTLLPIPEPSAPPADEKEREREREINRNPPSYSEAITPDGEEDQPAQTSPRQTIAKPARVFKRNPSFWDASKKSRNQLTLRRYNDVGIVTVTLNVSGTIFATSTNTLLREPDTLFATILEREEASIRSGKHIFLDRNPKYFGPILDYMRTGNFDRDAHIKIAKSIMIEAEFFKIGGMIKILHDVPEFTRKDILKILNGTERPKLRGLWLPTINLAGMDMTRANLDFSQLGKSNLRNVLLGGASICNATLVEVNLRNSVMNNAVIAHSEFVRANISNATMKFVKMLNCDFTGADLSYCVFEGADVQQCDFTGANLTGVDFTSADLSKSIFRDAIFSEETIFENTITKTADFEGSNVEVTKKKRSVLSMLGKKK